MEKRYRRDWLASIGLRERQAMVLVPSDLVLVDISPTIHAANLGPIAGIEKVQDPVDSLASGNGDNVVGTAGYSIVINGVDIAGNRAQNLKHLGPRKIEITIVIAHGDSERNPSLHKRMQDLLCCLTGWLPKDDISGMYHKIRHFRIKRLNNIF